VDDAEKRILHNQIEIMCTLNLILKKLCPDLAGRGGELDRMRDDLAIAAKNTKALLEKD